MMTLRSVSLLVLLILAVHSDDEVDPQRIDVSNFMVYPQIVHEYVPQKTFNKLVFENFTVLNREVNFELSTYFFMREGALYGDEAYKISNYMEMSSSVCRVYKTDLKNKQYRVVPLKSRPSEYTVLHTNTTENGLVGTAFTAHNGNEINVVDVRIHDEFKGINAKEQQNWERVPFLLNDAGSFVAKGPLNEPVKFLVVGQDIFFLTSSTFMKFVRDEIDVTKSQQIPYRGYLKTGNIIKAEQIEADIKTQRKRFYTLSQSQINIYQFISQNEINLVRNIQNITDSKLISSVHDRGFFYVTALDALYVVDATLKDETKVRYVDINGTCDKIQKYQTTLHLTCVYRKTSYVIQFFVLGNILRINRYFAGENIKGRVNVKRIGMGKMAIVTDNDIRIMAYGMNKNVLLELDDRQPEFTFGLKFAVDVIPLKVGTSNFYNTMIIFSANNLAVIQIESVPPELYCEFPSDKVGAQYQILMQYNTSRCSYIKNEDDLFYGNLESVCQISIPVLIQSKQVQLQSKHTNVIMIILSILIAGVVLLIIALVIKYNRSLENRFQKMQKQLEKIRKGYGKEKKVDI